MPLRAEQVEEQRQVIDPGNDLLDAHQHDVDRRRGRREAGVALVFHDDHRARVGHGEIAAGNAHAGGQVLGPQVLAGDGRQGGVLGAVGLAQLFVEQLADFRGREVHGGRDEVDRPLLGKLDDIFAQVGLDRAGCPRLPGHGSTPSPR